MSQVAQVSLLLVLMLLASVSTFQVNRRWYVPLAVAWTLGFLAFGWLVADLSLTELALTHWISGLLWAAGCIAVVTVAMAVGVAVPRLHPLFADERVMGSSGAQVAHKSLVEVPLGTVLLEEIVFRSVLLGLLTSMYGTWAGVFGSAFVFGLWHILPALEMHGSHSLTSQLGSGWRAKTATVTLTILATGGAGVAFAVLVVVSGSVLAPMGLHWATNGPGSIASWLVGRRRARLAASAVAPEGGGDGTQESPGDGPGGSGGR